MWLFLKGVGLWFFLWLLSNVIKWFLFFGECFFFRFVYKFGVFVDVNGFVRNGDKILIKIRLVKLCLEVCFLFMVI